MVTCGACFAWLLAEPFAHWMQATLPFHSAYLLPHWPVEELISTHTALSLSTAVVLGGTAITGGTGSLTGVMLGTLLIVIVQNSMILVGVPTFWQRFALGLLIIVGTGVSAVQLTRRRKRQRLVAE